MLLKFSLTGKENNKMSKLEELLEVIFLRYPVISEKKACNSSQTFVFCFLSSLSSNFISLTIITPSQRRLGGPSHQNYTTATTATGLGNEEIKLSFFCKWYYHLPRTLKRICRQHIKNNRKAFSTVAGYKSNIQIPVAFLFDRNNEKKELKRKHHLQ